MTRYVIRVTGALSDELMTAFPDLRSQREPVQTVLHGELPDQAALTGVLDHLHALGIHILEVAQMPQGPSAPGRKASA